MGSTEKDGVNEIQSASESSLAVMLGKITGVIIGLSALLAAVDGLISHAPIACKIWLGFPFCPESCSDFQGKHAEVAACNSVTANGYYWSVGKKLSPYGITMPTAQSPEEVPCDSNHVNEVATTWRWPETQHTWQPVKRTWIAANNGAGGDPECKFAGAEQGFHCGVFEVVCTKQP